MILAVLHANGRDANFTHHLESAGLKPDRIWKVGDVDRRGRPHSDSGFTITIADTQSKAELIDKIRTFLETQQNLLSHLTNGGFELVLDIGVTVGSNEQFTVSIELQRTELTALASANISVCFSAYPSS